MSKAKISDKMFKDLHKEQPGLTREYLDQLYGVLISSTKTGMGT
eukprot:UN10733